MKKSEMKANNVKTAVLQRQFRKWHQRCVFNGSELTIGFMVPQGKSNLKSKKNHEHMAKCSNCLIDRHDDLGFSPPSKAEFRGDAKPKQLEEIKL